MPSVLEQCDDVVELEALATTKLLRAVLDELATYQNALGRPPSAYTLWSNWVFDRGGLNNALDRYNDRRRAEKLPILGLKNVRHHGVPISVVRR